MIEGEVDEDMVSHCVEEWADLKRMIAEAEDLVATDVDGCEWDRCNEEEIYYGSDDYRVIMVLVRNGDWA